MSDFEIDFDDVALIRAFTAMGRNCEDKINGLVELIAPIIRQVGIGHGDIAHQKVLFKGLQRSVMWRNAFDSSVSTYPQLMAGVEKGQLSIWLETAPTNSKKGIIRGVLLEALAELRQRNSAWEVPDAGWPDIELRWPLARLLSNEDQGAAFTRFFRDALEDLREADILERIAEAIRPGTSG